jgi:energy-coupling factor transport system ATP-binding protein
LIRFSNVSFTYATTARPALHNVSLTIDDSSCLLITGSSGCGKSTLCRCINGLIPHFYGGTISGSVVVNDRDAFHTPTREMAQTVGMVFQDPENQLIKTQVESEIAFALEHRKLSHSLMEKRVEEALDTVGIDHLRNRTVATLSGGEKQKVAIASVLVMHPEVLVLDEPTSELDPKSAEEVLQVIKQLNEDLGLTVILVEHRIDRVLPFVDRVLRMDGGCIVFDGDPRSWVTSTPSSHSFGIPPVSRLGVLLNQSSSQLPLTIKEARSTLVPILQNKHVTMNMMHHQLSTEHEKKIVEVTNCYYQYPDGIRGVHNLNLVIRQGEFVTVIGRNASGKTTLAKLLSGLIQPLKGSVLVDGVDVKKTSPDQLAGVVGLVFQDPNMHLFADTVEEEISFMMNNLQWPALRLQQSLETMITTFNLHEVRHQYPRMLSSGQKQRVALASVLAAHPQLLILDEPTRGLDFVLKQSLMEYLKTYHLQGGTVLLISHDLELIAQYGDRVVLISQGSVIADGPKHEVLSKSLHFSPQINRLIQPLEKHGWPADVLTVDEVMSLLQ